MKKLTIKPVENKPDHISVEEFKAATRLGPLEMNAVTARQNVVLSNGLYEIVPEKIATEAEFNFNGVPISEMGRQQLFMAAMTFGVTIKNKRVETGKLREMVQTKFDEFVNGAPEDETDEE